MLPESDVRVQILWTSHIGTADIPLIGTVDPVPDHYRQFTVMQIPIKM